MKRLSKIMIVAACAAMVVSALALAGCSSSSSSNTNSAANANTAGASAYKLVNAGKLTIGSDLDYPPMESLDANGNPTGYDVAMMKEICKRIGLEMNYLSPQNFDSLMTQVNSGTTMDVAVSSITITDERAELVSFSDSYYDSNQAIVTMKGAYADKSALNDSSITVAAQSGTSGEDWIAENLPNAKYVAFTATTDAVTALVAGQVQAVVYDEPIAKTHVATTFTNCQVLEVIPTGEQYGIAVNKSNTKLLADINKALAGMKADGTLDKISKENLG